MRLLYGKTTAHSSSSDLLQPRSCTARGPSVFEAQLSMLGLRNSRTAHFDVQSSETRPQVEEAPTGSLNSHFSGTNLCRSSLLQSNCVN